jgi:hypothetical protein
MKARKLTLPVLIGMAATRGIMGVGAGLLLSRRVPRGARNRVGWTLFGIGAATTIPFAAKVFGPA